MSLDKSGKSRFGWSYEDEHNLRIEDNWTPEHRNQSFLLDVKVGDWIVHVNTPEWGQCVAARVTSEYGFDSGLNGDFRHNFDIDEETIIEFDRNDKNVLPTVNLKPRRRYHRVHAIDDFMVSLRNLGEKNGIRLKDGETPREFFLKSRSEKFLNEVSQLIHEMHRSKDLELFMKKVFERIEGVTHVRWNGAGGQDRGADLIISMSQSLAGAHMGHCIVVQVKSYSSFPCGCRDHRDYRDEN